MLRGLVAIVALTVGFGSLSDGFSPFRSSRPTTGAVSPVAVSDSFNRVNGALGANWATATGWTAPTVVSNAASGTGAPWTTLITATDGAITSGSPGIQVSDPAAVVDYWSGGSIP